MQYAAPQYSDELQKISLFKPRAFDMNEKYTLDLQRHLISIIDARIHELCKFDVSNKFELQKLKTALDGVNYNSLCEGAEWFQFHWSEDDYRLCLVCLVHLVFILKNFDINSYYDDGHVIEVELICESLLKLKWLILTGPFSNLFWRNICDAVSFIILFDNKGLSSKAVCKKLPALFLWVLRNEDSGENESK